ncbi:hypothetical protein [Sinorhizobium meliloti]|uniref:hypothetical protein n=1 Tax=Rhizobium meliloti TaxID=382 RepID=UPI003F183715
MTSHFHAIDPRILTPSDIELLQSLFDEEIKARRITYDCPEAVDLAARLIELYQRGVRNKASIREMLKPAASGELGFKRS